MEKNRKTLNNLLHPTPSNLTSTITTIEDISECSNEKEESEISIVEESSLLLK